MSAGIWHITLEEESDYDLVVEYEDDCSPVNVTGYGAMFQVRNHPDEDPLLTATVDNGRISIAGTTGQFSINVPAASINAIKDTIRSEAGYNLVIWPSNASPAVDPKRLLKGRANYDRAYADPS